MTGSGLTMLAVRGSNAALVTFLVYTLAVFGLAAISNRLLKKKNFLSEYFLGSRSLGVWAFALTFAATSASGGSFTGFPSKIYTHGWILGLWIGSYIVVPICAMGLLGKRINQVARISGSITVPDVIRDRFHSARFGLLAVSLIVFFMTFNLVAQFKAGSEILNTLLQDVPQFKLLVGWMDGAKADVALFGIAAVDSAYLVCLLGFAVAVIVYTTYGGFHAVVWTDVMQGLVMVAGVVFMLPLAIQAVGGLDNATAEMARMTPPRIGFLQLEVDRAPERDVALVSPWMTLPADEGDRVRLFRVNRSVTIRGGETKVANVKVVELTTPEEIDRQLRRLEQEATKHIAVLEAQRSEIPAGDAATKQRLDERIQRIQAQWRKAESGELALLFSPQVDLVSARASLLKGYAYGASRQGMYVTGPGPAPAALPKTPGLLEVRVAPGDVEIRVLDAKGELEDSRPDVDDEAVFTLESGRHQVKVLKDGYQLFAKQITLAEGETQTLDVELEAATDVAHPGPESEQQPASSPGFLPLGIAISFFFMWAISGAGQPSSMVRLMAFNSTRTLRRSIFTVAIYYSMIYFPLVIIFCCARFLLPGMDLESDRIMPQMAVTLTTAVGMGWLAGLLVAAPFAAVMSTVDSFLLMISSALVRDIYQRNLNPEAKEKTLKRLSFLCTFLVGAGAMLGAVNPPQFLQDIIVYTGSGLAACFLGPMVFALYWPRANVQGCTAGMLAGFGSHLAMYVGGIFENGSFFRPVQLLSFDPVIIGLVTSFAATYVVTKTTPPPPEELVRKYFYRSTAKPQAEAR